jgi:hypothetical protein
MRRVLDRSDTGIRDRILFGAWMYVFVFLHSLVLCVGVGRKAALVRLSCLKAFMRSGLTAPELDVEPDA